MPSVQIVFDAVTNAKKQRIDALHEFRDLLSRDKYSLGLYNLSEKHPIITKPFFSMIHEKNCCYFVCRPIYCLQCPD